MRIAVFVKGSIFHAQHGGLETQNQALCEGFVEKGIEVHIFTPQKELSQTSKVHNNIVYHFVPSKYKMGAFFGFFGTLDKNNWINKSLVEFIKQHEKTPFDVVISQSTAGAGVIRAKKDIGIKVLMIAHGSIMSEYKTFIKEFDPADPKKYILLVKNTAFALKNYFTRQRECIHGATKVVAVSNYVKKALIAETFAPEEKFIVINNGVSDPGFDISNKHYSKKILYVGRLEQSKGVHLLLASLKSLTKSFEDVTLSVAGSGPAEKELKKLASTLNITDSVTFLGWQDSDQLAAAYSSRSIFVLPSLRVEGFPMTLVEAASYGMALVASDMGGNSDAVKNGENGFLIKPDSIEQLTQKLLALCSDVDLLKKMGNCSYSGFKDRFTRDIMINSYLTVLQKL